MKLSVRIILASAGLLWGCPHAFGLEMPKDFLPSTQGSLNKQWFNPQSKEIVGQTDDSGDSYGENSKNPEAEIRETIEAKAFAIGLVLNIKEWKISASKTETNKDGSKLITFFGSYLDSSRDLIHFVELYTIREKGISTSYLFTRPGNAWSSQELEQRFKVKE